MSRILPTRTNPSWWTAVLAAVVLAPTFAAAGDWSFWGQALADYPLRGLDGGQVKLAEMRGDVVVVNFWASWCKPCKKELVHLDVWNASLAGRGARVLAVSVDRDPRRMTRFLESSGLSLPVFHDGPEGLAETLDLPALPCTVVLDAEGRVVRVDTGGKPETLQATQSFVESLIGLARASG